MTGLRNKIFGFLLSVLIFSCSSKKEMDREAYLNYLNSEHSGLVMSKTFNGVVYQLKCLTPEQQCLSFNRSSIHSKDDFDTLIGEYRNRLHFILLIRDERGSDKVKETVFSQEKYADILQYSNTEQSKDILLESENGTLTCSILHLESPNSVQPVLRMALSFGNVVNCRNGFTLVFDDKIFGNGPIKFNYSKELFEELPILNMQSI
jgi:hypothetical protein